MSVRLLLIVVVTLAGLLALALLLLATDTALSVWDRLAAAPAWFRIAWLAGLALAAVAVSLLTWRWLRTGGQSTETQSTGDRPDRQSLEQSLERSAAEGVDIAAALAELEAQRQRQASKKLQLAIFGEVSTGKSALVNALLPEAGALSDPRAGSTSEIRRYHWETAKGAGITLVDLPGFNLGDDEAVLTEARRAHLVIFLADGDLAASQHEALARLQALGKPLLLALNKADRYSAEELDQIRGSLADKTGLDRKAIVPVQTGGQETVVTLLDDGSETQQVRERTPNVAALRRAIQRQLDRDEALLRSLQDDAIVMLAAEQLDSAQAAHRDEQAEALVQRYSRRAVVGALAAVAPGSDLVIQGALASKLVQELCALYGVSVKEVEIESFLKLAGGRVRKLSALTMAITGNALKAFPGFGTLSGGLLHAVAYGMIFDSLGRAAAQTLAERGDLRPLPAALAFEEQLNATLEQGAGRFASLAVKEAARRDPA